MKPVRLQLSRKRGFNLQRLSYETNGLRAVNVARPTKWGNLYRVGERHPYANEDDDSSITAEEARDLFALDMARLALLKGDELDNAFTPIRGKNLACWCALDAPCHAEILLELANK